MEEEKENKKNKTNWGPTIISIIIGILVALGTTWYTVYTNKQEAREAENERFRKVQENLVSIIEEHIVNKDSLDIDGFNRIINNRTREESLYKRPSTYNLITQAEYNIQSSKHLSFDKKLEYSIIISTLYDFIKSDTIINLSNNRFSEETSIILKTINQSNDNDGKQALSSLIEKYEDEIESLKEVQIKDDFSFEYLLKSPSKLILITLGYLLITFITLYYWRLKRKHRITYERFRERSKYEEEKLRLEIEKVSEMLNDKKIGKDDRKFLEERLEHLFNRMNDLDTKYYSQHRI
jgi:hypothetical protein